MSIDLSKGQKVNLSKEGGDSLKKVLIGLGWDVKADGAGGDDFDLDAMAFLLGANGKVKNNDGFVFFGNKTTPGIVLSEDNLTGEGEGDDETMIIELAAVATDVEKIAVVVNIHEAASRNQNFGQVDNATCRIVNADTDEEIAIYDLSFDADTSTALLFGELIRRNDEWYFKAVGTGFTDGLNKICANYGVE